MKTLKEIEDQIAELQKDKYVLLSRPINGWREGEERFSALDFGKWPDNSMECGLSFKTPEEAELYAEMMRSALEIRGPEPVDWNERGYRYCISWDNDPNEAFIRCSFAPNQGTFYFHTEKQAQTMIDKWSDKLKLWVQGGVR